MVDNVVDRGGLSGVELVSVGRSTQLRSWDLPQEVGDETAIKGEEWPQITDQELLVPLMLLEEAALAPPGGSAASCVCDACNCLEINILMIQLQILTDKADHLQNSLSNNHNHQEKEICAAEVPHFLWECQPFFNHLESTVRSNTFCSALPLEINTKLLYSSQQLSEQLKQLVLSYASHNLLCLDETAVNSVSHFCIGQFQLGQLRVSTFLYCRMTPYLAHVDTGLYKCMRWKVDRLTDEKQQLKNKDQEWESEEEEEEEEEQAAGSVGDSEYYFLCCEYNLNTHENEHCNVMKTWSIGQWVQVLPDPNTEDIYDWIICEVPQGSYKSLVLLGSDEPSSVSATESLLLLL
ncbi:UPF0575 protein C19orf67 homolog [Antennarius striatus]|uniref:UPF0575 protein C19orf67 homolog n=1 Tax=Antennarius striatus TaxID=241820 RepID=UPI0035ADD52B